MKRILCQSKLESDAYKKRIRNIAWRQKNPDKVKAQRQRDSEYRKKWLKGMTPEQALLAIPRYRRTKKEKQL